MNLKKLKEEADKLIGTNVIVPLIENNQVNKLQLEVERNYIANDFICITYFKDTKFCCNTNLIVHLPEEN